MRAGLLVLTLLVAVGVAGGLRAVLAHESDSAFLYQQEHPSKLEPSQVEALIKKDGDPDPRGANAPAVSATCTPGASGPRRNPWTCDVRYASGRTIRYFLRVAPDGSYRGADRTGVYVSTGCCLATGE